MQTTDLAIQRRSGDGLAGVGWTLSAGQSSITRCPKTFASGFRERATDSRVQQTDGVQFTTADQLCLDGQKLEVVGGRNGFGGSEYRTESDAHAKIVAEGVTTADLDRIVDENWDPPVTMGVRLVSIVDDDVQHAGQAWYLRGLFERSR